MDYYHEVWKNKFIVVVLLIKHDDNCSPWLCLVEKKAVICFEDLLGRKCMIIIC